MTETIPEIPKPTLHHIILGTNLPSFYNCLLLRVLMPSTIHPQSSRLIDVGYVPLHPPPPVASYRPVAGGVHGWTAVDRLRQHEQPRAVLKQCLKAAATSCPPEPRCRLNLSVRVWPLHLFHQTTGIDGGAPASRHAAWLQAVQLTRLLERWCVRVTANVLLAFRCAAGS